MQTAATNITTLRLSDLKLSDLPRLGAGWPGQGGIFAGLVRDVNGAPDYLLILGPEHDGELPWQPAMDGAAGLDVDGHKDFTLPTRAEQAILFGTVGDQFQDAWYWSCEQRAAVPGYAWVQGFGSGNQILNFKSNDYRARAVRRLIIQ
jgi:hypothetical protein